MKKLPVAVLLVLFAIPSAQAAEYFVKHENGNVPAVAPTEDQALVYWVRTASMGAAVKTWAFVDDHVAGVSKAKGYFYALVPAGEHLFWSKAENVSAFNLEVKGGETYYLKQGIKMGGMKARVKLTRLDEAAGRQALARCRHHEITDAGRDKGTEIVTTKLDAAREKAAERVDSTQ